MQQPLFNLTHPSIQSAFDDIDALPQIPSNFSTVNAPSHPLNLSNHSDQSKHSSHSINTANTLSRTTLTPTNTINTTLTPPHFNAQDHHNTNISIANHRFTVNNNNNLSHDAHQQHIMTNVAPDTIDPDNVFTHNQHQVIDTNKDALQIYPSQPLIGDTIFDENERWSNTDFFSPGHEEIIGAWQTMFPLQQSPPHHNHNIPSPPYKRSRPAPLCIPQQDISNVPHTQLTAEFNDIGLREPPPFAYHHTATPSHVMQQQQTSINNTHYHPFNTNITPNVSHDTQQRPPHYDVLGENNLFPNHSAIQPMTNKDAIIPYHPNTSASLSSYPTRIAMPIVPAAYHNMDPSFWKQNQTNPSMYPFPNSKQGYLKPYTPYFEPCSAPIMNIPNVPGLNNSNNRPHSASANSNKPKGNRFIPALIPIQDDTVPIVASAPALFIINDNNNNNNNNNNTHIITPVKRKRGRPRKYKASDNTIGLQTPSPKKRKICKRSADRKNLEFVQYLKGDGTGPEMQIEDLSPQKSKRSVNGPNAKGFQRGGLRFNNNANDNVIRIIGGKDKSYKKPPPDHRAYNRIRIWKDTLGRQFYDCICNARKPVQDLNKIKSHVLGHDKIVWVCDICGREFFNNHLQLNAHMKTHKKREIKANEQPIIK